MPGLDQVEYFTNSTLLDVEFLPAHLIVVGDSCVGLEFAQIYRRFGSEVTVIELAPRLIPREAMRARSACNRAPLAAGVARVEGRSGGGFDAGVSVPRR